MRLILASASPRRARVLESLGARFEIRPADIDETPRAHETPENLVRRLAKGKALASPRKRGECVLAADTIVAMGRRILGKPRDAEEARAMLRSLSGRTHFVATGVAVAWDGGLVTALDRTLVRFRRIEPAEIDRYVASGEPLDKAGAYHIEGGGAAFIASVEGSPSNVAGLSATTARRLLQRAGAL